MSMVKANLEMGLNMGLILPIVLTGISVYCFWVFFVPRQLRGLQVAFITGEKKYEVHSVTKTTDDVRSILRSKTMRVGVFSYLLALSGCLLLLFEYLQARSNSTYSYNAVNIALALISIIMPATLSSGTSLGAQIIKPMGTTRATLQSNTIMRTLSHIALFLAWVILSFVVYYVFDSLGYGQTTSFTIAVFD